jgi:hypothetical protein
MAATPRSRATFADAKSGHARFDRDSIVSQMPEQPISELGCRSPEGLSVGIDEIVGELCGNFD